MSEIQSPSASPAVALLFEDAGLGAHLRKALVDAGARIVYEGPATKATREDLSGNGADVVIVNLDDTVERHLDTLYEIFDEGSQRIVFNDAEVSSGLSGWDQARWARHLAAKLLDLTYVDPPRPESARAVESHPTELMLPDAELPDVPPAQTTTLSWDANNPGVNDDGDGLSDEDSADLAAELEALLAEDDDLLAPHEDAEANAAAQRAPFDIDLGEFEIPDIGQDAGPDPASQDAAPSDPAEDADGSAGVDQADAVDESEAPDPADAARQLQGDPSADFAVGDAGQAGGSADDASIEDALRLLDEGLDEGSSEQGVHGPDDDGVWVAGDASGDSASNADEDGLLDFEDIPELTDLQIGDSENAGEGIPDANDARDDAEPGQSGADEAAAEVPSGGSFSLVDPEDDEGFAPAAEKAGVETPVAPDWGFVDFDAEPEAQPADDADTQMPTDPSEFGIEKLSPVEFLAPEGGEAGDVPAPGLSLELEPLEQAIAPKMIETTDHEMILDTEASHGIRRAVVIGAGSGDEARGSLHEFVSALDRVPSAALLCVAHHQGNGLEELAKSLDACTEYLKVRVASPGAHIRHGQMLLVPAGKQAAVDHSGKLQLLDADEQSLASPSIDLTMTLVAQEMGANVLAVVLAGDAIDALAGAQAVTDGGGKVWSVDPADCTDNTMVSVICEEQLAQFTGTPQALAARLLEEFS